MGDFIARRCIRPRYGGMDGHRPAELFVPHGDFQSVHLLDKDSVL
jgi:hypothetical protein